VAAIWFPRHISEEKNHRPGADSLSRHTDDFEPRRVKYLDHSQREIGRDITDSRLEVYYDNGKEVGRVVEDRPSTQCHAEIFTPSEAHIARHSCKHRDR
jgi:hypothetical protein